MDFSQPAHRGRSRDRQVKDHEIDPALVDAELRQAGFEIVERQEPFVERAKVPEEDRAGRIAAADIWMIVARRPLP